MRICIFYKLVHILLFSKYTSLHCYDGCFGCYKWNSLMIKPATYRWLQLWILMIFVQYSYIQYSFDKWQLHVCTVPFQVVYGISGAKGLPTCQSHDFFTHVLPSHFWVSLSKLMEYLKRLVIQACFEKVQRNGEFFDNWAIWSKVRDVCTPVTWEFRHMN